VIRVLLACYPPSFRDRYGAELAALVEDTGRGPRVCWDVAVGAAAAWLRPRSPGRPAERARRRLQAGLSSTWVAWCLGMLFGSGGGEGLLDPPGPGVTGTVRALVAGAWMVVLAGGAVAAGCGALLARRVLVRRCGPAAPGVAPLLPPVALLGLESLGMVAGAAAARAPGGVARTRRPRSWRRCSLAGGAGVLAVAGAAGPPVHCAGPAARPGAPLPAVLAIGVDCCADRARGAAWRRRCRGRVRTGPVRGCGRRGAAAGGRC